MTRDSKTQTSDFAPSKKLLLKIADIASLPKKGVPWDSLKFFQIEV